MLCLLSGVGFGMVIISAIVCVYYNVIIAWTVYYFVLSFSWDLPWSKCGNDWNTDNCYIRSADTNITVFNSFNANANITLNKTRSPSEEFFELVSCLNCRNDTSGRWKEKREWKGGRGEKGRGGEVLLKTVPVEPVGQCQGPRSGERQVCGASRSVPVGPASLCQGPRSGRRRACICTISDMT